MFALQSTGGHELRALHDVERQARRLNDSLERLSTGKRINSAKDDPSGLIAAEETRGEITDLAADLKTNRLEQQQERVAGSAQDAILTALHYLRGNVVTAANDTTSPEQRLALQEEADQVLDAVDRVLARHGLTAPPELEALRSGGSANLVDGDLAQAQQVVDGAVGAFTQSRVTGAARERSQFQTFDALYEDLIAIHTETLSQIEDADLAAETANFVQSRVLMQASYASLAFDRRQRAAIASQLIEAM